MDATGQTLQNWVQGDSVTQYLPTMPKTYQFQTLIWKHKRIKRGGGKREKGVDAPRDRDFSL